MRVPRVKWVNWRKIHKENVREDEENSIRARRERRKWRRDYVLSFIKDGTVDINKILKEIDRYGSYKREELIYTCYSNYVLIIALRFVAYKYGLGFEMREHKSGYVVAGCSKTYDVVLTRKS